MISDHGSQGPRVLVPLLHHAIYLQQNRFTEEQGIKGRISINSSLPLSLVSQTLRHEPGDSCRERNSAHRQQPDSNGEILVSEHRSLTTKLRSPN